MTLRLRSTRRDAGSDWMSASLLLRGFRGIGARYAAFSTARPYLAAGMTASGILSSADITCQLTLQRDEKGGIDWQRVLGLGVFGALHYGGPAKMIYLWYDRVFGAAPVFRTAMLKMSLDGGRLEIDPAPHCVGCSVLRPDSRLHRLDSSLSPCAQCTFTEPCCWYPTTT